MRNEDIDEERSTKERRPQKRKVEWRGNRRRYDIGEY